MTYTFTTDPMQRKYLCSAVSIEDTEDQGEVKTSVSLTITASSENEAAELLENLLNDTDKYGIHTYKMSIVDIEDEAKKPSPHPKYYA